MSTRLVWPLLLLVVPACSASSVFNFDADAIGKATAFTDTNNGISATFSSPADPGGFAVFQSFFSTLSGNVLLDPGPASVNNLPLNVAFSGNLKSVSLDFAVNASSPTPFLLQAYLGSTLVGSTTATDSVPPGFSFPEGSITFSGTTFDSLVLSSNGAPDFAVDNIAVSTTATPEPSGVLLVGLTLFISAGLFRLRRRGAGTN